MCCFSCSEQRWRLLGTGLKQGREIHCVFVQQGWRVSVSSVVLKHCCTVHFLQYRRYPLAPLMCERVKRRTVHNERGNRGRQPERDVNFSCKTWTYLPAEDLYLRALRWISVGRLNVINDLMKSHWRKPVDEIYSKDTHPFLSTGKRVEAADIIISAPAHRASFIWQRSIISTPSQSSSTTTNTIQQVHTVALNIRISN